ncbi:MAG: hypothetical protein ACR2JC_15370 [Chloroflexota bacterium]
MSASLSEFTWYSRLAILGGCFTLIVQAVAGRGFAPLTVLAVMAVSAGLPAFIGGLIADARSPQPVQDELAAETTQESAKPVVGEEIAAESRPPDAGPVVQPVIVPVGSTPIATADEARIRTIRVGVDSLSRPCATCKELLRAGEVAAVCNVCGSAHHAGCWINSDFHCSVRGCSGAGSLQPPDRSVSPAESVEL